VRIWLDTDIGSDVDDALALAYSLRHPGLEVVGVMFGHEGRGLLDDPRPRHRIGREAGGDRRIQALAGAIGAARADRVQAVLGTEQTEPPIVVPANVTFRTRLDDADLVCLADAGDKLSADLAVLCEHWLELQRVEFGRAQPRVALHDPLTVAVLVGPALCVLDGRSNSVDDRGATTVGGDGTPVIAAVDVDPGAVRDHVMSTLLLGR